MIDFTPEQLSFLSAAIGLIAIVWFGIIHFRSYQHRKAARRAQAKLLADFLSSQDKADEILKDFVNAPKKFLKKTY